MALTPPSTPPSARSPSPDVTLDDVFSSSPPRLDTIVHDPSDPAQSSSMQNHPSDIPRLRQVHATAGYREGISRAKAQSLQPGFDEGYGLGATFGLHVGYLLGALKGLVALYQGQEENLTRSRLGETMHRQADRDRQEDEEDGDVGKRREEDNTARVSALRKAARADLAVERIFGREYWREDGTWGYQLPPGDDEQGEEVGVDSFRAVVRAHPLIRRWASIVEDEMRRVRLGG